MTKSEMLIERLKAGWCSANNICAEFGWINKTLTAKISVEARRRGLMVERQRVDGVTSYRIAPASRAEQRDAAE